MPGIQPRTAGNLPQVGGQAQMPGIQPQTAGNLPQVGGQAQMPGIQPRTIGNLQQVGGQAQMPGIQPRPAGNFQGGNRSSAIDDRTYAQVAQIQPITPDIRLGQAQIPSTAGVPPQQPHPPAPASVDW